VTETLGRTPRHAAQASPPSSAARPEVEAGRRRRRPRRHGLRAVARLYARLTRRTATVLAVVMAAYVVLEVASYRSAYPDGVSPLQFAIFEDNPAVRMMNGVPAALDTAGGFTVWDGGWMMQVILAVWAVLTTSRLLRGEEDLDRTDLVLATPVRASAVTAVVVSVLVTEAVLVGAVAAASMGLRGQPWAGSALFGLGLAAVGATFVTLTAVVSQLVEVRRRVAGLSTALLGVAYLLRMLGNSADSRSWVRWTTPLGWMDQAQPFGADDAVALVPMLAVPALLGLLAVRLRAVRDTGGALLAPESAGKSHLRLLTSPLAFAWRSNRATLVAWLVGIGAIAAVMGALVSTMIDWIAKDEGYQQILASVGLEAALTLDGFVAVMAFVFGLAVSLYAVFRLGAARAEEESGRLEAVLARPVSRMRWLGGHVLLTCLGALALTVVIGVATWAGALAAGSDELALVDALAASANTLPVVAVVAGLTIALYGVAPRLTVPVPLAVAVGGFVLYLLGPALKWPGWVLDLSPFTHLAMVPQQSWAVTAAVVMSVAAVALAAVGALAFRRRDLSTA
jgi:ABC-2 type transport system permease protein